MPAFLLPDLGEGLTEAEIVTWHVQTGDTVTVDQPIVEVETAKAVVEVPVPFAGRITALHGQPGDVVAVGEPLVTVDTADRFAEPGVATSPAGPDQAGESGNVLIGYGTSSGRRRRHRVARSSAAIPASGSPAAATATTGDCSVPPPGAAVPVHDPRVAPPSGAQRQDRRRRDRDEPVRAPGLRRPDRSRSHGARRARCPGADP